MTNSTLTPAHFLANFYDALAVKIVDTDDGKFDVTLTLESGLDQGEADAVAGGIQRQLNKIKPQLKALSEG